MGERKPRFIFKNINEKFHFNKESTMFTLSKQRIFSALAVLVILVSMLASTAPVYAKDNGNAEYAVKSGETLTLIAKRFGLTVEKLLIANPDIKDPNLLYPGQVIILPVGRSEGLSALKDQRIFVWVREKNGGRVELEEQLYLVKSGDTLKRIASSYGLTLEKLLSANPQIDDPSKLFRGELIHIPEGRAEKVPPFYSTPHTASK
jgi:LysM repeat protein